jgi:biopolymer transport protein ExbB
MDHILHFSETAIVDGTLCLLGCFSLVTWSVILFKAGELIWNRYRLRQLVPVIDWTELFQTNFRHSLSEKQLNTSAGRLWQIGQQTYDASHSQKMKTLEHSTAWHELIERNLKQQLQKERTLLDSGLGWLASIGSTAPFVGLFGTVWGIMHALKDISSQGNANLEVVAGPIGEALIATAVGLAVAIPSVIAYNFFLRQNRKLLAHLEHFATDFLRACIQNDLTQMSLGVEYVHSSI